jgi:serine/threonine protein kinase
MTEVIRIPKTGDVIGGKYQLQEEIGRGGFGIVFRSRQLGVERTVAVKMLLPHAITHEGVTERFKREARLASQLRHANSVQIYDYGIHHEGDKATVQGLPYIAMEYLEGETLQSYLIRHRRLKLEDARDILDQTLSSLGEAHRLGIVHRDLKPENIFLCNRNRANRVIKVLDFGIAKAISDHWDSETRERLTRTGLVAGTAEYMAPEQASGQKDITPAVDVYAMGCIAFQMLTGHIPYDGNSPMDIAIKHISDPLPKLPPQYEHHPVNAVVTRAMSKKATDRFRDANHFQEVLASMEQISIGALAEEGTVVDRDAAATLLMATASSGATYLEEGDSADATALYDAYPLESSPGLPTPNSDLIAASPPPRRALTALTVALMVLFLFGAVIAGAVGYKILFEKPLVDVEAPAAPKPSPPPPAVAQGATMVTIDSKPTAEVYIDGKIQERTPYHLFRKGDEVESPPIELRKEGYEPHTLVVRWTTQKTSDTISHELKALPAPIAEAPTPAGDEHEPPAPGEEEGKPTKNNKNKFKNQKDKKDPLKEIKTDPKQDKGGDKPPVKEPERRQPPVFTP